MEIIKPSEEVKEFVASHKLEEIISEYDSFFAKGNGAHSEHNAIMQRLGEMFTKSFSDDVDNVSVGNVLINHLFADVSSAELARVLEQYIPEQERTDEVKSFLKLSREVSSPGLIIGPSDNKIRAFGKVRHYLLGGQEGVESDISACAALTRYHHGKKGFNELPLSACPDYSREKKDFESAKAEHHPETSGPSR